MPVSHSASAHGRSNFCSCSGRASVAKSRSVIGRCSTASRTEPPTRYSSWPAAANRPPSSRRTSAWLFNATAAAANSSASWAVFGHGTEHSRTTMRRLRPLRPASAASDDDAARGCTEPDPAAHYRRVRPERLSTPATIAWVSDGENPQPRRRRGRRRGRRSAGSGEAKSGNEAMAAGTPAGPAKPGAAPLGTPRSRAAAHRARDVGRRTGHRQHRSPA